VAGSSKVERNDFALDTPLHVRHFFGTLINQKHHERDFRMIGGNTMGNILE